ncbi:tldc domain-containing protein [Stylonychia lemnae]|uniref:Tldc domain-containing protein n=1 Tax=Stylonychia lemnae TaxID=5949 RepID=A0A077ZSK4_STYLE|nr:tldc domain-containing protein [Stylonychia lemnae]|eukprot:CDW72544.1 tldc domain-containing protein [Stylonychia lemnae]
MMERNKNDMLTCFCCKKFYNLQERRPVQLPCGDVLCMQCYHNQRDQVQNQQIQCPFDASHLCANNQPIIQPLFLIRSLEQHDFYLINCDKHPKQASEVYCKNQNKMVCSKCLQFDPHQHHFQDPTQHFAFDPKFLEESFERVLAILREEAKIPIDK